jgi:hypothetical protein
MAGRGPHKHHDMEGFSANFPGEGRDATFVVARDSRVCSGDGSAAAGARIVTADFGAFAAGCGCAFLCTFGRFSGEPEGRLRDRSVRLCIIVHARGKFHVRGNGQFDRGWRRSGGFLDDAVGSSETDRGWCVGIGPDFMYGAEGGLEARFVVGTRVRYR